MTAKGVAGDLPPDQDQRDLIANRLDCNMLVEAAAGTGKTASMVGRMVALLRTGTCADIRTMAAVTFTRKAAAELRSRFQVELEKAVRPAGGEERARLERALGDIEHCFIGTIHSFCGRLLRERPVEAGVDLSFTEIEEVEDERLRDEAWTELITRLLAYDPDGILSDLYRVGLRPDDLIETFQRFATYPDVDVWPMHEGDAPLPDLTPVRSRLISYLDHMRCLAPSLPADYGSDKLIPLYLSLPRIASHYEDLTQPDQLMEVLARFDKDPGFRKTNWARSGKLAVDDALGEKERWDKFRSELVAPMMRAWHEHRYAPVMRVCFAARNIYDRRRAELGCLNFQDLLMLAASLLRDKPHIRRYFSGRFTHLLVDEFQDTDPIQAEVLLLLAATDPGERDWRRCRPRPGSLFVVGDPKQSIYRFRRADIVTYNEVKEILLEEGLLTRLSANFRSTGAIIDWVNLVFGPRNDGEVGAGGEVLRFPTEDLEESPAYVPLIQGSFIDNGGDLSGVMTLRIPEDYSNSDTALVYEADRIARSIRRALDRGASPSDFMIVTFRNKFLGLYAQALQQYGIPHRVSGGSALNQVDELELLHVCVRSLAHPDDPVSLVAALRSELFGISDTSLFSFKQAGGRFSFHEEVPGDEKYGDLEPIADAFLRLRRYQGWLNRLPLLAALERIVADLGLEVLAAARPGGDVQAGSLAKALEVLRSAQAEAWTLAQAEEHLERLVGSEERYDGISALSQDRPAVRVMNVFRVKGLESPVVFLADVGGGSQFDVELHIDRSGSSIRGFLPIRGRKNKYGKAPLLALPPDWDEAERREMLFSAAENLRKRYVAATRACSALVVTLADKSGAASPWRPFVAYLDGPELPDPGPQSAPTATPVTITPEAADEALTGITHRLAGCESPTYEAHAGKKYALAHPALFPGSEENRSDTAVPDEAEEAAGGEHGVEWGTVIHLLLEAAARQPGADLETLAAASLAETGQDPKLATAAVELVRSVLGSEIWRRSLAAARRLTEVPFHYLLDEDIAGLPTLLRGSVDLAFEEDGNWVLVDYKTDAVSGAGQTGAAARRYAPQLRLYARAWEAATGRAVREMLLYFIRPDALVQVI